MVIARKNVVHVGGPLHAALAIDFSMGALPAVALEDALTDAGPVGREA
ncbi:hypothetical protein RHODO2019_10830 [Rhodococcus antarcticus]|uniref:Uncharacterized protein n=1 Tax=Rhodococcus antarcticus TaxID=2987751 RepID=A0ABY6NWD6_9NOCA|nr:hypothetical protein [Rhodococcus antarcticus]UZJ23702.1 hypothetical protein RHODO2019_10830 [Rhodococcus antarcticus]